MALVPISRRCAEKAWQPPIRGPCQSLPAARSAAFEGIPSRFIRSRRTFHIANTTTDGRNFVQMVLNMTWHSERERLAAAVDMQDQPRLVGGGKVPVQAEGEEPGQIRGIYESPPSLPPTDLLLTEEATSIVSIL